jgi:acetyl-CoA acetyltransferase
MLTGPVDVTKKVLERSGMKLSDIDLFELNEAFASVVLRYIQAFNIDSAKINVNGGAIAMGHPLGATGAMILHRSRRARAYRKVHRAGDAVHRRRHGHRHHHRAGVRAAKGNVILRRSSGARPSKDGFGIFRSSFEARPFGLAPQDDGRVGSEA